MAIINDNDMEIVLKGSQEEVIRKMLRNRLFCLLEMPAKKPDKCRSDFSSSVFVGFINDGLIRTFAIRNSGTTTAYEDCEYYLAIYRSRGKDSESKGIFKRRMERIITHGTSSRVPTIKELLAFLKDKELVLITNYMRYGNFEPYKVKDFLEELLLLWKDSESEFFMREESCDIKIFLKHIKDDDSYKESRLCSEDIRNLDIGDHIVKMLKDKSIELFNEQYYSVEFEARSQGTQAMYFVTRFHSNKKWDADPVNIVNARISAFVLPGTIDDASGSQLPPEKIVKNRENGAEYMIDSIHFNSDIFFDIYELEKFLGDYFCYFSYD